MVIITLLISYHKPWIDILNKKEKYLGFILFIVVLPIGIYLIMSRLLLPVYAFSTTVKGFALSSFAFINVYMIVSFLGLLFRLPTASLYDRVSQEILAISKISQMISLKENTSKVFDSVVEYVCLLTESDACWLMLQNEELENLPIVSSVHLSDIDRSILELPEACCLGNWVIDKKEPVLVHNVSTDERTVHLKMLDVKWKSILAVPLFRDDSVVGILYSAKKSSYAYDEKDLNTLKSFGIQINIALGNADISGSAKVIDADRIMSKPSVQILNNEKIELAVSVINSASTSLTIGFVPVSSKEICFYSVCLTESGHEMEMELRGVLKTLFTLESDFNKVFIKTIDILCDSKRIKDLLLNLFLFDEQLSEMRVVSNFPLAVMCFKHSSQTTISSITKMLENKPDI
ncbi:MAG: GAF domain-containing protein, partial [Candidatus Cloacimonetes bacterium]|nr:GAF domain-containing protein [Candidatus Cloacimonadota bacterium]